MNTSDRIPLLKAATIWIIIIIIILLIFLKSMFTYQNVAVPVQLY